MRYLLEIFTNYSTMMLQKECYEISKFEKCKGHKSILSDRVTYISSFGYGIEVWDRGMG